MTTLDIATVYRSRPHILVYVETTGKTRESQSELAGSISTLIDIKADQRLKPENQQADLQKKIDRFISEIGDKYQLVDQQIKATVLDYHNGLVDGGSFTTYASDFNDKLAAVLQKLGYAEIASDESSPVLLIGPYVSDSYRSVMRHIVLEGKLPNHPIDSFDVMGTLIPSMAWEQLTDAAKKEKYFGDTPAPLWFLNAFKSINDWTPADFAVMATYADRAAGK